ncbi:hypothetical protein [Polaromonas sp. SM01]|uniref:hypothetical protein n=1 Tax=Polaromonas sp. SM01 TaxID=3085630 RepID=UPI00298175B1|nr:hypothetical protein [Polaromonas sp. SM01]MDW5441268.1 hypothetical protein [Polaromonas sp. SM01]
MNKFSMRVLPVAVALSATLAFAAQAQMGGGVRDGTNSQIDSDARAHAMATVNGSTSAQTPVAAQSSSGVKGTVSRTANRVEGAMGKAADATKRTAKRTAKRAGSAVGNSVGSVAERADRGIQNALPAKSAGSASVNMQGSGNTAGQVARPPQ